MTESEKLLENYENAFFSLLMYKIAQEEGKAFLELNDQLKNDPNASVSPELYQRCLKTINKAFAQKKRKRIIRSARSLLTKAAVVAVITSALFITAYAVFPGVRMSTLNLLIETSDVSTRLSMTDDVYAPTKLSSESSSTPHIDDFNFPEIISGYKVAYRHDGDIFSRIRYENKFGSFLQIQITRGNGTHINLDTEDADVETLFMNETQILFVEKDNRCHAAWHNSSVYFTITTLDLSKEQVILWIQSFLDANS